MTKLYAIGAAAAAVLTGSATAQTVQTSPAPQLGRTQTRADLQTRISAMFIRMDSNHDGFITKEEASAAQSLASANSQGGERGGMGRGFGGRIFDMADLNRDGKVSLSEVQQAVLQRFDAMDLNHDGTITPDEREQARARRTEG